MELAIRRELGAEVRTFRTVKGAQLWLSDEDSRRVRLEAPLEWGCAPRSVEQRDKVNATWAALAACFSPRDPHSDSFTLMHVHLYAEWCRAWTSQRELARDAGMTLYGLRRVMNWTEQIIRRRMENRCLLEAIEEAA